MKKTMAEDDKIINLEEARLKLASKEPPSGGNWLSKLPFETRFLARQKSLNNSTLMDFLIASDPKDNPFVFLGYELSHRDGGFRFVDPVLFSRDYEFFCTIKTEVKENDRNTVEAGRVGGDGKAQVVDQLHETE